MIKKELLYLFNSNLISKFVIFAGQIVVAGILTPAELGGIKSALSYVELLSVICLVGLNTSILFKCDVNKQDDYVKSHFTTSVLFGFIFSLFMVGVVLLLSSYLSVIIKNNDVISNFKIFIWILPFLTVITLATSTLQSLQKYKLIMRLTIPPKIITLVFLIVFTYFFSVKGYIYAYYLGLLFSLFFILYPLFCYISMKSFDFFLLKSMLGVGKNAMLSNIIGMLGINIGLFFLNAYTSNPYDIGQYAFALMIYLGFEIITQTIQQYYLPKYSEKKGSFLFWKEIIVNSQRNFIRISFILSILAFVFFYSIYDFFPEFKYNYSMLLLSFMSITWFFTSFYALKGMAFISLGLTSINLQVSLINLFVSIPVTFVCVYFFSVKGAIISRFIVVVFNGFVFKLFFDRFNKKEERIKV